MGICPDRLIKCQYTTKTKATRTRTPRARRPSVLVRVASPLMEVRRSAEVLLECLRNINHLCRLRIPMFQTRSHMNHLHLRLISLPRRINPTLTMESKDLCTS